MWEIVVTLNSSLSFRHLILTAHCDILRGMCHTNIPQVPIKIGIAIHRLLSVGERVESSSQITTLKCFSLLFRTIQALSRDSASLMEYIRDAIDFLNLETWRTKEESDFLTTVLMKGYSHYRSRSAFLKVSCKSYRSLENLDKNAHDQISLGAPHSRICTEPCSVSWYIQFPEKISQEKNLLIFIYLNISWTPTCWEALWPWEELTVAKLPWISTFLFSCLFIRCSVHMEGLKLKQLFRAILLNITF